MATKQVLSRKYEATNFVEDMDRLFKKGRATGNTTRQADFLIQLLFENKGQWVPIIDHASLDVDEDRALTINQYLVDRIKDRLNNEHMITKNSKIQLKEDITVHPAAKLKNDDYYQMFIQMFYMSGRRVMLLQLTDKV